MPRNARSEETRAIESAADRVGGLLPHSWTVIASRSERTPTLELRPPRGPRVQLRAEWRRSGSLPVEHVVNSLRELSRSTAMPVLYLSDYIGPALRRSLAAEDMNFVDETGWVRLALEDPLVAVSAEGADRAPRSGRSTALQRLNGVAANRTLRALAVSGVPVGVRELAARADVAPGSVSKLLATLAADGIVDRESRGSVSVVRRRALIRRWARDYSFTKTNSEVRYLLAPRGVQRAADDSVEVEPPVVLTGSAAARRLLPPETTSVVPLRLLALYASDPDEVARSLGFVDATPSTANVVLARPQDARLLDPGSRDNRLAPLALVLADLLTLPSRSDAEAEQLMDALARTDPMWSTTD
ncbi:helix-turn-helix domain-containing protein [Rathayibacter sp. VKM Ac-2857]|nr:helix-turn-helix domain-containing protein [Rathayibacter sp. VKM Ac-2857]NQX17027.1 helix-turn-helix domain-containing protein [Rathayibacter sp. VKM Ac-2857]